MKKTAERHLVELVTERKEKGSLRIKNALLSNWRETGQSNLVLKTKSTSEGGKQIESSS